MDAIALAFLASDEASFSCGTAERGPWACGRHFALPQGGTAEFLATTTHTSFEWSASGRHIERAWSRRLRAMLLPGRHPRRFASGFRSALSGSVAWSTTTLSSAPRSRMMPVR